MLIICIWNALVVENQGWLGKKCSAIQRKRNNLKKCSLALCRWWNLINESRHEFDHHQFPSCSPVSSPLGKETALLLNPLPKSFNGFLLHVNVHSLVLTPQPQMVSPPQSPWTLLKSTRLLSLLLNAKLFPTSGFCTCYFLCLECVSFCFSHDWVFLILQILTEMSLPQQSLSWPYCLKLVSPVTLCLCTPFPS